MHKGQITSEETKRKQREAAIRRYQNPEEGKKTSLSLKGKKRTPEQCKRISIGRTGKPSWNKGKTGLYSLEYREKLSIAKKGKPISEEHKKKIGDYWRDKPTPYETKVKISDAHVGHWYGAVKHNDYPQYCELWTTNLRYRVKMWYGFVCVECGTYFKNGYKLHVHHVNYNKKTCCDNSERLLVTLCAACHLKTSMGDREYWKNHFADMIHSYYQGKCWFTKEEMLAYTGKIRGNDT